MKIIYYILDHYIPCLRPAFCHKNKDNYCMEYLNKWLLEAETHIAPMVLTLWVRLPLLEPPLYPLNWQNLALLWSKHGPLEFWCHENNLLYMGPSILPCLKPAFCHKNKENYCMEYLNKWLFEAKTHIYPMVVTLRATSPLFEPPFVP